MSKQRLLDGEISITRPSGGAGDADCINVCLKDKNSRIEFLRVEIGLADFAEALTGLSCVPAKLNVRSLELVGKTRVVERAEFRVTRAYLEEKGVGRFDRKGIQKLLQTDPDSIFQRAGWELDTYLGSQQSIVHDGEDVVINSRYVTYEDNS